jgi:hypothetical protein
MKSRTLSSYFCPVSKLQVNGVDGQEQEPPPPSSVQVPEEIDGFASAPPASQGTGQDTVGTKVSATQTEMNRFDPLNLAPTLESSQPSIEPETVGIEEMEVEEEEDEEERDSNHVLDPEDIIVDHALQKPIEEMDPNISDAAKREYVLTGPCQPIGHTYPVRVIYGKNRRFHDKWYTKRPWLEYSISKDAAFFILLLSFQTLKS